MNNSHPLDVAAALAVVSMQALGQLARLVLVHTVALVLTLSGWRPEPSADVSPRLGKPTFCWPFSSVLPDPQAAGLSARLVMPGR